MNALIYGLTDPRNGELRYVGRTTQTLKKRWTDHVRDARDLRDTAPRFAWIRELQSLGLQPEIFLIEEVTQDEMREAEGAWIAYFRYIGARLLNVPYRNGEEGARHRDFDWTPEIIAKLGTVPDAELGKELGLSRRVVENKRHKLGIPKCGNRFYVIPPMGGWNRKALPKHIIDRLGKVPDYILGNEIGVAKTVIARARKARGIPDYASQQGQPTRYKAGHRPARWNKPGARVEIPQHIIDRLGKVSDAKLAKEIGIKPGTLSSIRRSLGISSTRQR